MQLWGREAKAREGADAIFRFATTRPASAAPTVSVLLASGTVNVGAMTAAWTAPTVTSVNSADRTQLNLSAAVADARGMAGDYGDAWLVSDESSPIQVRVLRFIGGGSPVAHLAEPLPAGHTGAGELVPAWYYVTLTAAAVTGTAQRNARLTVSWTEASGDDSPGFPHAPELDLHIVREPFATGVTEADVLRVDSGLASSAAHRDLNSKDAISAALGEVIIRLREDLAEQGWTEDDVPRQHRGALSLCHAHLAAERILEPFEPEAAQRHRDKVWGVDGQSGLWKAAMRRIFVDADGDGVVDDGEVQQVTGPRVGSLGSFTTATADNPNVTRNSRSTF